LNVPLHRLPASKKLSLAHLVEPLRARRIADAEAILANTANEEEVGDGLNQGRCAPLPSFRQRVLLACG